MSTFPLRISIARRPGRGFGQRALLISTLALAIGANTVIFSIVNVFALRPLPIAEPERVGFVVGTDAAQGNPRARTSREDYLDLAERNTSFVELAAFRRSAATLSGRGEPERVVLGEASATLFPAWGIEIATGRGFQRDDEAPGAAPVALLADRTWREQFAGADAAIGSTLILDGVAHTVVGVMPKAIGFGNLSLVDVWTPLGRTRGAEPRERRDLFVCGRLRPGVSHPAAAAEMKALSAALAAERPETNSAWSARVVTTRQGLVGEGTWFVLGFLGLVVVGVLVVACANVSNLLLTRVAERRAEYALRSALGAGARRLLRESLAEQATSALAASLLGLGLAAVGLRAIQAVAYEPFWKLLTIDTRVALFAALLAAAAMLLASLAPGLDAARGDLRSLLAGGDTRGATSKRLVRLRRVLAAAQLAAAIVVVVPASLIGRSVAAESRADWGFDLRGLTVAEVRLPPVRYADAAARARFAERLEAELGGAAEVAGAALFDALPLFGRERVVGLELPGRAVERAEDRPHAVLIAASARHAETLGVRRLAGAALPPTLVAGAPIPSQVNRAFADRWFPDGAPLGRRFRLGEPLAAGAEIEIVGVVADVKSFDVTEPADPAIYVPLAAVAPAELAIAVRAAPEEAGVAAIRAAVRRLDAELAVERPTSLVQRYREEMSSNRVIAGLFASFGVLAVVLAAVGLFGLAAHSVAQRKLEFGVRMALGAGRREIVRGVLGEGARLAAWGGGAGLVVGVALAQLLRARLYGVSPLDPWTFGGAALGLALFTLAALALPARRAAGVDPARLLRVQ
jgi:putative ABC transport system permease protein